MSWYDNILYVFDESLEGDVLYSHTFLPHIYVPPGGHCLQKKITCQNNSSTSAILSNHSLIIIEKQFLIKSVTDNEHDQGL